MTRPRLQIVRGLPGAGKSTFAVKNWPHLLHLEFDFFCMRGGLYAFGDKRNTEGQAWLAKLTEDTMIQGLDFVLCGVFAGNSEHLGRTVSTALKYGYDVWIKMLDGNFGNTHGVRQKDYDRMVADFLTNEQLELIWRDYPRVHFGTMPTGYVIAPMKDGK